MKIDSCLAQNATATFFKKGAFRKHYSTQSESKKWAVMGNEKRCAASDQPQKHRKKRIGLEVEPVPEPDLGMLSFSNGQKTEEAEVELRKWKLLYTACMAGCSKDVRQLCHDGVNAGYLGKPAEATCLQLAV